MRSQRAAAAVDDMDRWSAAHREFLEMVWSEFEQRGEWPDAADLTRRLFSAGVRLNVEEVGRGMPPGLGRYDPQHRHVMLSVRGAWHVTAARDDCEHFVDLLREVVRRYATTGVEATVTADEIAAINGGDEAAAGRVVALCGVDSWALFPQGPLDNPDVVLNDPVVFAVADVDSVDAYLDAQAEAWWPDPQIQVSGAADQAPALFCLRPTPPSHPARPPLPTTCTR
jgi:hypothetical protein